MQKIWRFVRFPCLHLSFYSPSVPQRLQHALLGNTCLSFLSRHYKLPSLLPAETLASPSITSDPAVQAALFRAYVAGLWEQEGEAYTRQWLRQCFRSFINNDYAGLRKTIAEQEAKKLWPMNAPSPDTPLNRFNALVKVRKFEVEWKIWAKGVPPRQAFKAEVRFNGATLTGGGRTARTAQQDAAAKALEHISVRLPYLLSSSSARYLLEKPLPQKPQLFENRKNVVWRSRLLVYCLKHRLTTKFDTQETEKNSYVFSSRLKIDGHQWEATGLTKEHARSKCVISLSLYTVPTDKVFHPAFRNSPSKLWRRCCSSATRPPTRSRCALFTLLLLRGSADSPHDTAAE